MSQDLTSQVGPLARELSLPEKDIKAVLALLAEGGTVHFIARYRKEATGGLDEVQIRTIEERATYLHELGQRRQAVLSEIESQGKLSDALRAKLEAAETKAELEDLYLPFKPKRRTRAMIAAERGLLPLAEAIWAQGPEGDPEGFAAGFVDPQKEVPDVKTALAGARDILAERLAESAELRRNARELYFTTGVLKVEKTRDHADKVTKFDNYAEFSEAVQTIASHRYLAIRRGETEGVLRASLDADVENYVAQVERQSPLSPASPWASQLQQACREAATRQLLPSAQVDVRVELKMRADKAAIDVFATNLRQLLMAAPLGTCAVLGIDPGQRTGCKCAVVDETGKLLAHDTFNLVTGTQALARAREVLTALVARHPVRAVAVGNGTHGRETELFVKQVLAELPLPAGRTRPFCVSVSESGASVYSASDVAREEFPDLDLTVRGAISIARRLQDPLAELVKLDPKSIGVGQYQHDVLQTLLGKKLGEVVASCVHDVGVELNLASASLLAHVSGLGSSVAKRIVLHRNERGAFSSRKQLLEVPGLGPRAFEQAAGFLRIRDAENPLDRSAVHPERYPLVENMARDLGVPVAELVENTSLVDRIPRDRYASQDVGSFTLDDIIGELKKPGRDPRESFEAPEFRDDVTKLEDLKAGMRLQGVVTNVTAFGAFVDVGVHQDGLVHVSQLADRFIKEPSEAVKVGDRISVLVLEVDLERKRISLSARKDAQVARPEGQPNARPQDGSQDRRGTARGPRRPDKTGNMPARGKSSGELTHNPFAALVRR